MTSYKFANPRDFDASSYLLSGVLLHKQIGY